MDRTVFNSGCPAPEERGRWPALAALGPALFVWVNWAALLIAALVFVSRFGIDLPLADDWDEIVPVLVGEQPVTLHYLWSQHNEHRIVLPRLIQIAMTRLSGNHFRGGMLFNVLAAAGLAGALMLAARRQRGRFHYADALFPWLLLNWGHWEIILESETTSFTQGTVLACLVLLFLVHHRSALPLMSGIVVGSALLLMPLCGANGLCLVPPLALWLGCAALMHWRRGTPLGRRGGLVLLFLAGAALVEFGLYFVGLQPAAPHPYALRQSLRTSLEFLTNSLGQGGLRFWPVSGYVAAALLLASIALLAVTWYRRPEERFRALGLLAFLGGMIGLALGIGWGRTGLGPFAGFASRYMIIAFPVLGVLYFTWELYGPRALRRLLLGGLFLLVAFLSTWNFRVGQALGRERWAKAHAFTRDLHRGMPAAELARRHPFIFLPAEPAGRVARLQKLLDAGIGPFRR